MAVAPAGSLADVVAAIDAGQAPGVELGLAPAPSFGDRVSVDLEGSGAPLWLPAGDDPARIEAGYRFVKWMMEPAQIAEWVIKTGSIAIRTSATADPKLQQYWTDNPFFEVATAQVSDPAKPLVTGEARIAAPEVATIFSDAAAAVLVDGADPVATLADAAQAADAAIAAYNARVSSG